MCYSFGLQNGCTVCDYQAGQNAGLKIKENRVILSVLYKFMSPCIVDMVFHSRDGK